MPFSTLKSHFSEMEISGPISKDEIELALAQFKARPTVPVFLNVYHLSELNDYVDWAGFGAYHSGICVHGREWGYGKTDWGKSLNTS